MYLTLITRVSIVELFGTFAICFGVSVGPCLSSGRSLGVATLLREVEGFGSDEQTISNCAWLHFGKLFISAVSLMIVQVCEDTWCILLEAGWKAN